MRGIHFSALLAVLLVLAGQVVPAAQVTTAVEIRVLSPGVVYNAGNP
jgi:hypothetical protein